MGSRDLVNKFTSGELDPKFIAEVDYDGYRKAARKLRNVAVQPQGGCTRRFGTTYEQVIKNGANFITNIEQARLIEYEHANDEFYDIIIRPDTVNIVAFDIYLAGVFQVTVVAPANSYTVAMIRLIRWVKDYDRLILLHQQVFPYELRRIAANNWVLNPLQFQFFPTYDFTYSDNPATLPTPNTPYWTNGVTLTPNAMAATMVTASIAIFTSNHVGGLIYGNGGVFRINSINAGGTVATGYTLVEFIDTSAIRGDQAAVHERAWNNGAAIGGAPAGIPRLWPGHGCFYQSRLVLGGSTALPGTAFASVVKSYFDFDDSDSDPSSSWGVEIGVTGNDIIQDILATKSLILLSNKGPGSTSNLVESPTTPLNAFLNSQGTEGSRNMNSVMIDNQILYADRAGNTIWSMAYEIPDTGYTVANASILSTQLIRGPRWADIFDPDDIDGRYYLLCNSDGTLAMYNTIKDENIFAWTLGLTTGSFIDVSCVANQAKVLTRRKVNTGATTTGGMDAVYTVDATFNAFRNKTVDVNAGTPVLFMAANNDYMLVGNEIPFDKLAFTFFVDAGAALGLSFEFLTNTSSWETFTPTSDTTAGFTMNGTISWAISDLSNWKAQSISRTAKPFGDLAVYYWIRIRRNNAAVVTIPVTNTIFNNTQNRIYMEKLDFSLVMDCTVKTTSDAAGNITGLTQLAGQNVFMFADDFPLQTYYVNSAGSVNITSANGNRVITAGLDYTVNITPMPCIAVLGNGLSVYEPVKVMYMYLDFNETLGLTIQGQNIPQASPGIFMTEDVPEPVTDYYKVPSFGGWDPRKEFIISQSYPAPLTLLAISYTMEVSP